MIWSNANTTKIGDVKILYDNKSQTFKLIESTKTGEGFIEVKSGNYEELEEFYNARVAETEDYVLDENIEGYENVQRGDSWDLLDSNKRSGNGRVGSVYQGEQGSDATADNERGGKNSQTESLIDIDNDGDDWVGAIVTKVTADKLSETLKTERKEMQKALRAIKDGDKTVSIKINAIFVD